jgi:phosphoenolpyruvate carboxykinase (ATP)
MDWTLDLSPYGINVKDVRRNCTVPLLYEEGLRSERGTAIVSSGALVAMSGAKTGRSPADKRIVERAESRDEIWWGDVNIKLSEDVFLINHERAIDYLNTRERLYVVDGFAGWDPRYRLKIRVICERAYHALFMLNMLVPPTPAELANFGEPDFLIFNAGHFPANKHTAGMTSKTSVDLCFERREFVILGTEYAGEMKKGIFTIMNYLMPKRGVLSMHCSATEGHGGDVTLFFGLSGTGKTTLSADPKRRLIGDDEHCWSDEGVFNIEGGCYAKVIDISPKDEPQIYKAIRYGAVLENVVYDAHTRDVDYHDVSVTTNTRASYPLEFIDDVKMPALGGHPRNVIFLTCDAFGVLPPVSRLTPAQAMYHFINGYTAKIPGTEVEVKEPKATFSACYGAPFLVWPPHTYARLLADKMAKHKATSWLINTGWSGGAYPAGKRMSLPITRALIDAIHEGKLAEAPYATDETFGFAVPTACPGVPSEVLQPRNLWKDKAAFDATARKLAGLFRDNFKKFADQAGADVRDAGPRL